jgi:predicted permease
VRWPAKLKMRCRSLFRRGQIESDLDSELRDHLEQGIAENLRAGMTPEEAKFAAQRLIGSISLYKEECRDAWGTHLADSFIRDMRYALRMLRRTPLFTAAAIIALALGIGANTTVFTFLEDTLLRQLPVPNAQQLVSLNWGKAIGMSYPNYVDFRDRNSVFSDLMACHLNAANLSIQARENFRIWGYEVSGNYFEGLGIKPALGRFFGPSEDTKPGANPVIVLSYREWQTHFGADPNVAGRLVKIDGYPFTVIGVAPRSFLGTELLIGADFWVPASMEAEIEQGYDWLHSRDNTNIFIVGRLKPGVSRAQAAANLDQIARQLAHAYPNLIAQNAKFQLTPPGLFGKRFRQPVAAVGAVLAALAAAGLLLACINLAGMLLARAADRHHEIGVRLAIGASRFQLLRQFMTESLLLAVAGGFVGFLMADIGCRLINSLLPPTDLPIVAALRPDTTVLYFTAIVALGATVLFGLAPALQAARTDIIPSLKNEPVLTRFRKFSVRDVLIPGQIALSVMLVICSILVVRSLQRTLSLNLGFNPENAVSVSFDLRMRGYTQERIQSFHTALLTRVSALPGIQSAGITNFLPLGPGGSSGTISRADRPVPKSPERQFAMIYDVSPGYLRTAQTRLLSGRDIDADDRENSPPVAIVNEALAHLLFGNENPLGQYIRLGADPKDKGLKIIGVVETGKYISLNEDPRPALFRPIAQSGSAFTTVIARTHLPASKAISMLRKAILDLNPGLTLFDAGSLRDQLGFHFFPARGAAVVLGAFGVIAMALAATGLFALMAYAVSRRTREIGIRMALGAQPVEVLSPIFGQTIVLCVIGFAIGTLVTLVAGKLLSAILYGVSPYDPITYITALLLMTAVAVAASWNPAHRAIHIDPATTLREQ